MTSLYFHVNIRNVSTAIKVATFSDRMHTDSTPGIDLDHVHFQHKTVIYFVPNIWQYLHNCAFL